MKLGANGIDLETDAKDDRSSLRSVPILISFEGIHIGLPDFLQEAAEDIDEPPSGHAEIALDGLLMKESIILMPYCSGK